jgi:hypothetical protein
MTLAQRLAWRADGSPFELMQPLAALRDRLRGMGYTVYDVGNNSHLDASPPEDHTPYSATGYPGKAKYGVGYAIDVMPPAKSGLPSLQALGAALKRDADAGLIPWLKYMNWGPVDNAHAVKDSWRAGRPAARTSSSDTGHIHGSGMTGYEDDHRWDDYDPFSGGDMQLSDPVDWPKQFQPAPAGQPGPWLGGTFGNQMQYVREDTAAARGMLAQVLGVLEVIGSKVDIDPAELDQIRQAAQAGVDAAIAAGQERLIAALTAAVREVVEPAATVSDEAIEEALRRVFADAGAKDG